jgi:two-component system, NarL family, nitrate/nitrite response regulator NarL
MPIRLVLIDDHPLVLRGLEQLLDSEPDFEVVASCGTMEEGWHAVTSHEADVLVLDLKLHDDDGLSLLRRLDPTKPPAVVVLTASQEEDVLLDAARLGARAVVLKAMAPRVLEDCLRAVHQGGYRLNVNGIDLAQRLAERQTIEAELENLLTPRELEILRLVALHLDNQQIADRLAISVGTVKIHLHHIYDKLKLQGRHQLQLFLRDRGY